MTEVSYFLNDLEYFPIFYQLQHSNESDAQNTLSMTFHISIIQFEQNDYELWGKI